MAVTLGDVILYFKGDDSDVNAKMNKIDQKVQSWGADLARGANRLIGQAIVGSAEAVIGFMSDSVTAAMDFEEQMDGVRAIFNATEDEGRALEQAVKKLALDPKLKVGLDDAALAMEELGKGGASVEQVIGGLTEATVLLQNATGKGYKLAAEVTMATMQSFAKEGLEVHDVIDQIVGVTQASRFDLMDYNYAMANAGGVASSLGVEFDDFNNAITAVSSSFASGRTAGTAFKTFLTRLIPTSKAQKEAFEELGFTVDGNNQFFDEATGKLKDMDQIIPLLNQSLGSLTEQDRNELLKKAFGTEGMLFANALAGQTAESYGKVKTALLDTSAQDQAAIRTDNLKAKMDLFNDTLTTLKVRIGEAAQEPLSQIFGGAAETLQGKSEEIVQFTTKVIQLFADFFTQLQEVGGPAMTIINDALTRIGMALGLIDEKTTAGNVALAILKGVLDAIVIGVMATAVGLTNLANWLEWIRGKWNAWYQLLGITNTDLGLVQLAIIGIQAPFKLAGEIVDAATKPFRAIHDVFWDIIEAIDNLLPSWQEMIDAFGQVTSLELPPWLKSGSPPPLANALRDINKQIAALPDLSSALGGLAQMGGGGAGGAGVAFHQTNNISGVSDAASVARMVQQQTAALLTQYAVSR